MQAYEADRAKRWFCAAAVWMIRRLSGFAVISLAAAQQVIDAPAFGAEAQSLHPFSGLQEGFAKLS